MTGETTALQKIENARKIGALVFVDQGAMMETTPLYKLDVTEMVIDRDEDCFNISGKFMPKREIVDRIGDACGVTFILGGTKGTAFEDSIGKRTIYTAFAQGQKLLPDGSYRKSSICTYDFDYVLRAMLDFDVTELNEKTKQTRRVSSKGNVYGPTLARYILELQKVASQRANTGARLRVIRELAGMPESFTEKDIKKPLYFGRMIQNTDYILKTPAGNFMATAKALGISVDIASLFGAGKATAEPQQITNAADETLPPDDIISQDAPSGEPEFPDEPGSGEGQADEAEEETEIDRLTTALLEFTEGYRESLDVIDPLGHNPYKIALAELERKDATEDTRRSMINRLRKYLQSKGEKV